jgi:hypothetical protein
MAENTIEVFVAAFDTEGGAGAALKDFQSAERAGAIDLIDGAVPRCSCCTAGPYDIHAFAEVTSILASTPASIWATVPKVLPCAVVA